MHLLQIARREIERGAFAVGNKNLVSCPDQLAVWSPEETGIIDARVGRQVDAPNLLFAKTRNFHWISRAIDMRRDGTGTEIDLVASSKLADRLGKGTVQSICQGKQQSTHQ